MRKFGLLGLIVIGLLSMMAATRWLTLPPEARQANGAGQFDATRAKARLARVLGDEAPHPADSAASDGVRDRLVAELRAMGLSPRVDDRFACNKLHKASGASCARVRNVTVTIGPEATAPHVLINSHYDSVPVGPGASDAGLGVAAMLEAAALMKDRPLVRRVTFLFNEGEEAGLIGARAFLDGDPVSRRVDALINLEARGTTGPVNMFETSVPNAAAIRLFKDNVERPVANSLAVSAYRLIPNYTDVNSFVEDRPDWLFLNFAPIGNETRYHSPGDDLAAVDLATLQHMGDQLLAVGGALGSAATPQRGGGERLFMNVGTRWLFTFPLNPLLLAVIVIGGVLGWLFRTEAQQRVSTVKTLATAMPFLLIALLLPVAAAWSGLTVVGLLREGQFWRALPAASEFALYAGVVVIVLAMLAASRRWSLPELRRAWWTLFVILGGLFALAAPGALVYFLLPPVVFLIGALLQKRWPDAEAVGAIAAALLLFVTLGGMLGLLQDLLNSGPLWVFALLGGLVLMPWLIEARPLFEGISWRRAVPVAAAFAALAWLPAALVPAYGADRQQRWTTQYVVVAGRPPVWSIVNDRKALPAEVQKLAQWRQGMLPLGIRQRWIAPAPAPAQPGFVAPGVTRLGEVRGPGKRLIRLRIAANGADTISLTVARKDGLKAAGFNDRSVTFAQAKAPYALTCTGRSCDGAVALLETDGAPLDVQVTATHWRLPPAAAPLLAARPKFARPQYLPDATVLVKRIRV